jgi:hypothetical protein
LPKVKRCLFCQQDLKVVGRSREHVFPQWMLRWLNKTKEEVNPTWVSSFTPKDERHLVFDKLLQGNVCSVCNNGWMSDLEAETKSIVERCQLVSGQNLSLTAEDVSTLARWAYKTAITLNTSSNFHQLFMQTEPTDFHATRALPNHVFVDVMWHSGTDRLNWTQLQSAFQIEIDTLKASLSNPLFPLLIHGLRKVVILLHVHIFTFRVLVFDLQHVTPNVPPSLAKSIWPISPDTEVHLRLNSNFDGSLEILMSHARDVGAIIK